MPRKSKPVTPTDGLRELPHSLARVFRAVRETSHTEADRTTRSFCTALRAAYAAHPLGNGGGPQLLPEREKLLQTTEGKKDGSALFFYHLWAYAQYERVPTALFPLISSLISRFEHEADHGQRTIDGTHDDAFRTVSGLYALLNHFMTVFPLAEGQTVNDGHVRDLLDAFHHGAAEFDRGNLASPTADER